MVTRVTVKPPLHLKRYYLGLQHQFEIFYVWIDSAQTLCDHTSPCGFVDDHGVIVSQFECSSHFDLRLSLDVSHRRYASAIPGPH